MDDDRDGRGFAGVIEGRSREAFDTAGVSVRDLPRLVQYQGAELHDGLDFREASGPQRSCLLLDCHEQLRVPHPMFSCEVIADEVLPASAKSRPHCGVQH